MTKTQVLALLKENRNERGIANWKKREAKRAAKAIGPIDIDYGDENSCEAVNVLKHLTSDYLKKKLGR